MSSNNQYTANAMRRAFRILAALAALIGLGWSQAHAQVPLTGAGRGAPGAAAYSGPGDVVSGAFAWWGLRCYNAAYTGNVADVYAPSDATHTLVTCSTGGILNETLQSLATTCATSCTVKTLYDQSGGSKCTGACDVTQATIAFRPVFTLNCSGTKPCLSCTAASSQQLISIAVPATTPAQPITVSLVANRTGATTAFGMVYAASNSSIQIGFSNSTNTLFEYAGLNATATAADNAFHAVQNVLNDGSSLSVIYVDGVSNAVSAGTNGIAAQSMDICGAANLFTGKAAEVGIWTSGFNATQQSNMNSNQRSYWGF